MTEIIVANSSRKYPARYCLRGRVPRVINKRPGWSFTPAPGCPTGRWPTRSLALRIGHVISSLRRTWTITRNPKLKSKIGIVHRLIGHLGPYRGGEGREVHESLSHSSATVEVFKVTLRSFTAPRVKIPARSRRISPAQPTACDEGRIAGRYGSLARTVRQRFGKFTLLEVEIKTGRSTRSVHLA